MTWKPHYYADVNGRVRKISEMTLTQVSSAIKNIYAEFKTRDKQLHALHERLWQLRKKNDPNIRLTNTRIKILEQFKLKSNQANFIQLQEENDRLKTILGLALENISSENLLMVENILKNAFIGDEKDD